MISLEATRGSQLTKKSRKSRSPSGACASAERLDLSEGAKLANRQKRHILLIVVSCQGSRCAGMLCVDFDFVRGQCSVVQEGQLTVVVGSLAIVTIVPDAVVESGRSA